MQTEGVASPATELTQVMGV